MAHIYVGDTSRVENTVLDALQVLGDDYTALVEFDVQGRNVDLSVIRPAVADPATVILAEIKCVARPLRGTENGPWETMTESGQWEPLPTRGRDVNPYHQTRASADALQQWLWNNQHLYQDGASIRPREAFRVWPDVVLISPPDTHHLLPIAPSSRYGRWFYSLDAWVRHVTTWKPRRGVSLSDAEVSRIVEVLGLAPLCSDAPQSLPLRAQNAARSGVTALTAWGESIDEHLHDLDRRIARLERLLPGSHDYVPNGAVS